MMIKKIIIGLMLTVTVFLLTGCMFPSKASIELSEDIPVVGIDEEDGQVKLTITTLTIQPVAEEGSEEPQKVEVYTAKGETVFDAVRNFHSYTDKDIFWGHMEFVIVGEETAKKGITGYLDFFIRDHETNLTASVIVAQGSTAEEFIKKTKIPRVTLSDYLQSLFTDVGSMSESSEVSLIHYMCLVNCDWENLYLPCIQLVNVLEKSKEEEDIKDVQLNGYAIFNDQEFTGIANGKLARGINWMINEISSGIIVAKDPQGEKISLEIIDGGSEIETDFSGDEPTAKIKVQFSTNIGDYKGVEDIFKKDIIDYIVADQERIVKKEIEDTLAFLQKNKSDVIHLGDKLNHKYPVKTKDLLADWDKIFSNMEITVEVESRINRIYEIKAPAGYKDKEKGK